MRKLITFSLAGLLCLFISGQSFAQLTTVDVGVCSGCESYVTATFDGCDDCVDITSCKDLSNVVLLLCDSTEYKYDGLSGTSGTFCSPDGQDILGVWVKSGCYQSGDGPGYGYYLEGPCGNGTGTGTLPTETVTEGSCSGCESEVEVTFDGCSDCVDITSCKELSNVVLLLCDGEEYKYDGLSGNSGTFCSPDGQNIVGVWVKSGCYQSGDGPGYGYWVEGPCGAGACDGSNSPVCSGPTGQRLGAPKLEITEDNFSLEGSANTLATFNLLNSNGTIVYSGAVQVDENGNFKVPSFEELGLTPGVYMYQVIGDYDTASGKLFID
ncbi:MAG: hypothetical protein NXI10_13200 [bacterium]|nr:hypothetical protein [bacterium]